MACGAWLQLRTVIVVTQRIDGFRGGVQEGSSAGSGESRSTESLLRQAVARVRTGDQLIWKPGFSAKELSILLDVPASNLVGANPDGGVFLAPDGRPLVAAEAKRQGMGGNAIERWFKNYSLFSELGCKVYLTVCTGEGFFDDNPAQRTLQTALATLPAERHRLAKSSVWNKPEGSIWLYRFEDAEQLAAFDLDSLLRQAVTSASSAS